MWPEWCPDVAEIHTIANIEYTVPLEILNNNSRNEVLIIESYSSPSCAVSRTFKIMVKIKY